MISALLVGQIRRGGNLHMGNEGPSIYPGMKNVRFFKLLDFCVPFESQMLKAQNNFGNPRAGPSTMIVHANETK
jgi:hypothetical protein